MPPLSVTIDPVKRAIPLLLAAALLAAAPPAAAAPGPPPAEGGGKKADLPAVVKSLSIFAKKKSLGKRDPEDIAKRIDGLAEEDLAWVLERLGEVPEKERGEAAPAVAGMVQDRILSIRYTPAVLRLPDAWKRLGDPSDAAREALLPDLARLEDAEPATRVGLWALEGGSLPVRLRAVDTLADLCSWGGDAARLLPALRKALADPSPAVRDLALDRLANLCDAAALDWCLEHMGEPAEETVEVRGTKERRCPGDRALVVLSLPSKLHFGLDGESFRGMEPERRAEVLEDYRKWRAASGGNPLRDLGEGPFEPIPKVSSVIIDPVKDPSASVRWWSEIDRAQFRLDLAEIMTVAVSQRDWVWSFELHVVASGARQGSWDALARKVRCGARHRLPRKGFGLVETSLQMLLDGRYRIWVRAYEWRGG